MHDYVSVIIPAYNRAWILKEAIESVLKQDYNKFELIVVDDGSTDHTDEILNSYTLKSCGMITVIRQEHRGVSAARNAGVAASNGGLIAFLDSDDLWFPGKLTAQVDFFHQNPLAMICQTEEIWVRNGRRVNPGKKHKKYSGMIFEKSLLLCIVSPSAVMMRRSLFESIGGFDETLPACEDYDLWLRISCNLPIYLIEQPLIIKRGGHEDQLSSQWGLDKYRIMALKKVLKTGRLTDMQYKAACNVLEQKAAIYAAGCIKRSRFDEAAYYEDIMKNYAING